MTVNSLWRLSKNTLIKFQSRGISLVCTVYSVQCAYKFIEGFFSFWLHRRVSMNSAVCSMLVSLLILIFILWIKTKKKKKVRINEFLKIILLIVAVLLWKRSTVCSSYIVQEQHFICFYFLMHGYRVSVWFSSVCFNDWVDKRLIILYVCPVLIWDTFWFFRSYAFGEIASFFSLSLALPYSCESHSFTGPFMSHQNAVKM